MKKTFAIIPARGGSKRIPRKNCRDFLGKPLISYSIEAALKSEIFDEVMVSTDDEEIAAISRAAGAAVPFMRSVSTSDDHATTTEVLIEVIEEYKKRQIEFEQFCCIYPTAPFLTAQKLCDSCQSFRSGSFDMMVSATPYSFPPQRSFFIENGKIELRFPENMQTRSQDLPEVYHDAGQFYWCCTKAFLREKKLFGSNAGAFALPGTEVQDIDTPTDWKIAELKYKALLEE